MLAANLAVACLVACSGSPASAPQAAAAPSEPATVAVQPQPVRAHYFAYGQVEPIALLAVRAVEAGRITALRVVPGSHVRAGQVLTILGGPLAASLLAERRGALRAASIQLKADRRKLTAQLVTRQAVAADEAAYAAARGQMQVALQTLTLRAPADGQVLAVEAADGEQVATGQLILTLQTSRPWLNATFYGADALAIHPGMSGQFQPTAGSPIPVRVSAVSQALELDGGEHVGLFPVSSHGKGAGAWANRWRSGQWGKVTLDGEIRPMLAVPTRALILDGARWWVLVRTPQGDRRQEVVPGPTSGWMTYVSRGLKPGEQIVVQNAYLEFHRGIAQRYLPPD